MGGQAAYRVGSKTRAQGGEEQAGVAVLPVIAMEQVGARWRQRSGRIGLETQGVHRGGQGQAAQVFAGQQLAAGHVPGQGAEDDLATILWLVFVALVFEYQIEALDPGLTGIEPACQAAKQAAYAEQQGVHLICRRGQGQAGEVTLRWYEPGAWIGQGTVGLVKQISDGLGLAPGQPAAWQAPDLEEAANSYAGEEIHAVAGNGSVIRQGGERESVELGGQIDKLTHLPSRCKAGQPAGCNGGGGDGQLAGEAELGEAGKNGFAEGFQASEQAQAGLYFEQYGVRCVEAYRGGEAAGPAGNVGEGGEFKARIAFAQAQVGH